jgi:N-acetylglutamate synthase-like GNAT family acetyltransferase
MMPTIRRASTADAATVCAVLRRSITECCVLDHQNSPEILEAWLRNKTEDTVRAWLATETNVVWVAQMGDDIVGVAMLEIAGVVALCYVLPEALHKGIGMALLTQVQTHAIALKLNELRLSSTQSGYAFYSRHGFTDIGPSTSRFGLRSRRMVKLLFE